MDEQDEALRARAEARLGTTLKDKYRLDRVLGIGGMATVFAATHRNQAELAVKLLHPELSLRDDLRKRFLREGYVGNSVKHPGAVLVVDDDVAEDGSAFLVMELLRGASLEAIWERSGRHIAPRAALALVVQLLDVLSAAHEKAIVHRDLKPANLFLTVDGSVKVLDFGIARLRDAVGSSEHATRTGTLMGTPAFMAPEQAQAIVAEIDAQTDVWAVGATMFTLLSGLLVHEGNNSSQILIKAGTSPARPLLEVAPATPRPLAEIVDKALAFDKASRWPSAEAMRDALIDAAIGTFGRAPGRDDLAPLVPIDRMAESARTERAPSNQPPRLVVGGERSLVEVSDPTFATPAAQRASVPVSSGQPRSRTAISAAPTPLAGTSTSNPVSAESPPAARRVPISAIVTTLALLTAAGAVAFAMLGKASVPDTPKVAGLVSVVAEPPPSAPPPSPPRATPPPETPPSALASAQAVSPPPRPTTPAAPRPPAPVTRATASPVKPWTTPGASQPRPAASADCPLTYTLNASGDKIWKSECEH